MCLLGSGVLDNLPDAPTNFFFFKFKVPIFHFFLIILAVLCNMRDLSSLIRD